MMVSDMETLNKDSGNKVVSGNFRVMDNGDIEVLIPSGYSVRFEKLVSGELEYIIFERS